MLNKNKKNVLLLNPFVIKNDFKIYDMKFNPCFDSLSISDIDGNITFYRNNQTEENCDNNNNFMKKIKSIKPTNESVMSISYSDDGQEIYGGTCGKEIFGIKSGKPYFVLKDAHR